MVQPGLPLQLGDDVTGCDTHADVHSHADACEQGSLDSDDVMGHLLERKTKIMTLILLDVKSEWFSKWSKEFLWDYTLEGVSEFNFVTIVSMALSAHSCGIWVSRAREHQQGELLWLSITSLSDRTKTYLANSFKIAAGYIEINYSKYLRHHQLPGDIKRS